MFTTVFIALLLSCCLSLASVIPFDPTTGVITECTVPNTVALTFVRSFMFATSSPSIDVADLFFFFFSASFFRMTVHTTICTTMFFKSSQPCSESCILGRILLRLSEMPTQKEPSFSVREALTFIHCPFRCLNIFLFFFLFRWRLPFVYSFFSISSWNITVK